MKKPTLQQIKKRIEVERAVIVKARDRLRDLKNDLEELENDADDAQSALADAIRGVEEAKDYLSRNN